MKDGKHEIGDIIIFEIGSEIFGVFQVFEFSEFRTVNCKAVDENGKQYLGKRKFAIFNTLLVDSDCWREQEITSNVLLIAMVKT